MRLRQLFENISRTGEGKTAVVGWGRGMGHKGHMMLASSVITHARDLEGDPYFVVSRSYGPDDPLEPEEKLAIYRKVFPEQGHIFQTATDELPDLTRVLANLNQQGYTNAIIVVGADQKAAFQYLNHYNGKPDKKGNIAFDFENLQVISRQETSDPSREEEGPRATPMRAVLMDPSKSHDEQFAVWRDAMSPEIDDEEVMALMHKAQQRMTQMAAEKKPKKKQGVAEDFFDRFRKKQQNYGGIDVSVEKEDNNILVKATANGRELGRVLFTPSEQDDNLLVPLDLEVDERYRGQGIGATMYDYVKNLGYTIRRSQYQTDAGAGFWDKHKSGKNVWEQGVAEGTLNEFDHARHVQLLNAHMQKLGYENIGAGLDAQVFAKETGPVKKILMPESGDISSAENSFLAFYNYCQQNARNPHLPKFHSIQDNIELDGEKFRLITMERLQEVDPDYDDMIMDMMESIEQGQPLDPQYKKHAGFYRTLQSVMATGRQLGFEIDIMDFNNSNVMQRGHILVIADPWTEGG
jgi:GNAT superfamily N-acetyltransferase